MFNVLFQVSWKLNFSTEAIRNTSLEPNYRVALNWARAYHAMSHVLYFCLHTSNTCKIFRIPTLYVNNLELDNNVKIRDKGRSLLGLFEFYFYLFFLFLTLSVKYFQFETKPRNSFHTKSAQGAKLNWKYELVLW